MADPIDRPRPFCVSRPTAKLMDVNNLQPPALSFQRAAVEAERLHLIDTELPSASHTNTSLPQLSSSASSTCPTPPITTVFSSEQSESVESKELIVLSDDEDNEISKTCKRTKGNHMAKDHSECLTFGSTLTNLWFDYS